MSQRGLSRACVKGTFQGLQSQRAQLLVLPSCWLTPWVLCTWVSLEGAECGAGFKKAPQRAWADFPFEQTVLDTSLALIFIFF